MPAAASPVVVLDAMDYLWVFRCEEGHAWEFLHDSENDPPANVSTCAIDGTDAVTASRLEPADRVVFRLTPAARVSDPTTGSVYRSDDFYLEMSTRGGLSHLVSTQPLAWADAIARAADLRGRPWDDAVRVWERMGLGAAGLDGPSTE